MSERLTVLVQAYACNPRKGSEEGVGWGWVKAIAEHHDLHVLTAEYHRADIEEQLRQDELLQQRVKFHFVQARWWHYAPSPTWVAIENSALKPVMNIAYRLWQRDAYRTALRLSKTTAFDLVHVITYVGFRFPGSYWKMPYPLVWGPIGGLENTPWRYFPVLGLRGGIMFAGRNLLNSLDRSLLPGPKKAFRKAEGGIIAATSSIQREIRNRYGVDSIVRCEIGVDASPAKHSIIEREANQPLEIVWSGLHIARKALPLLLNVLSELPDEMRWRLTVLGSGPLTSKWQQLAKSLELQSRITWTGRVSRDEAVARTANSHVMVISSVYDLTSTVIVEALSVGLPVVCPSHYGFRDAVDDSCGILVDTSSLDAIREGMKEALLRLYDDETLRQRLAHGAFVRAEQFCWRDLGKLVSQIYRSKVAEATLPGSVTATQ
jgi:glycosyltransferase involved in cell wall biosynthesis